MKKNKRTFQVNGKLFRNGAFARKVVFQVTADDKAEAKDFFAHGGFYPSIPPGFDDAKIDLRTVQQISE